MTRLKSVLEAAGGFLEHILKTFFMLKDYPVIRATELKFYQEFALDLAAHPSLHALKPPR